MFDFGKRGRSHAAETQQLAAVLDSTPYPFVTLQTNGLIEPTAMARGWLGLHGEAPTLSDLYAATENSEDLRQPVTTLLRENRGFDIQVFVPATGRKLVCKGRAGLANGQHALTLWLDDCSEAETEQQSKAFEIAELTREVSRFQQTLDSLNFPCWRRDTRGKLVWCNAAYAHAVDLTADEAVAEQREFTDNLRDRAGRTLAERALRDGRISVQTKHVVISGNRRLMEFTEIPVEGGTLGFVSDMTAIDDLKSELGRHIASHSEVLETLTTAVAVFGADQKIKFHNSAFYTLWGLEENWLLTQPTLSQVLERLREDRQLPEQADFRGFKQAWLAMFTSLIEPHQELMSRPDGTAIRLAIVPHPMGGLLFTFEDVTSRLALESSYNTLIAVQRETLDNLAEGIAVFGGDGRLDLWNPAFSQMWGLPGSELAGRPHITELTALLRQEYRIGSNGIDLMALMISNAVDRMPQSGRIERSDGSVLEYHSVLLPDGGVLNSFVDVTDGVRVELALRERNAALIAADQLKLDFLANVSYQLRTPLNAMIGFAEILIKQYFGPLNDKQMEYARGTLEAGERLVMLVDAILDLSTIEAGYMRLHTVPIFVDEILDDILVLAEDWADKQEVSLIVECPDDIGTIEADERRLKQVLLNLISNALKFTPTGGRISLSAKRVMTPRGEEVALAVSDTGSGIPEADQARVFEPFEGGKQRKMASSAGVGLALVKSFVTLHGGRVELESMPGAGTKVICYLPVKQPQRVEEG